MSKVNRLKEKHRRLNREGKMREIPLPTFTYITPESKWKPGEAPSEAERTETWDYGDAIEAVILRTDQPQALTYKDLKACDAINAALEASKANPNGEVPTLLLEEADYEYLRNKIEAFPYRRWSRFLTAFITAIKNAPQVEVKVNEPPAASD